MNKCSFGIYRIARLLFFRWLRQQDRILNLPWKPNVRRSEKSNVIDQLVSGMAMNNGKELSPNTTTTSSCSSLEPPNSTYSEGGKTIEEWSNNYFTEPVQPFTMVST
jgi:hypothetical protein